MIAACGGGSPTIDEYIETLKRSTSIQDHVRVDFELRGCPVNKYQLLEVLNALLNGRAPNVPTYSECIECKRRGTVCVMVASGKACLGRFAGGKRILVNQCIR